MSDPKSQITTDFDRYVCGTAKDAAAQGLLALMCGLSEDCWCAGWMSGTEYALWRVTPGTHWGQGIITERQATLLKLLSDEARGWWFWHESKGEPFFVSHGGMPVMERSAESHD